VAAVLGSGCPRSTRTSTDASKELGSQAACPAADGDVPSLPEVLVGAAPVLPETPGAQPVKAAFQGTGLLPPSEPGQARSEILGCLAAGHLRGEALAARYPPRAHSEIRVNALPRAVLVTHEWGHPCCLRGEVAARVEGGDVRIEETLSGARCQCECGSVVRVAVALSPGAYTVRLVLRAEGAEQILHTQTVEIEASR
jgi:hypothetical protein